MDSRVRWHSVVFWGHRLTVGQVRMHGDLSAGAQNDLAAEVLHTDD